MKSNVPVARLTPIAPVANPQVLIEETYGWRWAKLRPGNPFANEIKPVLDESVFNW